MPAGSNKVVLIIFFASFLLASTAGGAGADVGQELKAAPFSMQRVKLQVPEKLRRGVFKREHWLTVPEGMKISLFAAGLGKVRFMALGKDGHLYASVPKSGRIVVLPDTDGDGTADEVIEFASGLDLPHGLAFHGRDLFVAETGRILKLTDEKGDLRADKMVIITEDVPPDGGHWTRTVAIGPDERLYLSVGSSCNICLESDERRAAILQFPLAGGKGKIYARGLRNSVGIAFHPATGELWASNNGRDWLGDDLPPEEINRIVAGGDYGWPYCFGQRIVDPKYGTAERCRQTLPPVVEMQAHSAPLGIAFGDDLNFPEPFRDMLYVAFHGSWNRTIPTGYKLVGIPFINGAPSGPPLDIVTGWLQGRSAWGRPVAPVAGKDGALYLSDDSAGAIYRLVVEKKR